MFFQIKKITPDHLILKVTDPFGHESNYVMNAKQRDQLLLEVLRSQAPSVSEIAKVSPDDLERIPNIGG